MTALVTGGAGYIGSHMALALLERGERVIILDNLSTGLRHLAPAGAHFVYGDVGNRSTVSALLAAHEVDCVFHFAGSAVVPDSVRDPLSYYANNTCRSRELIQACTEQGVRHFIFSSTAAVYGPSTAPMLDEDAETAPANPYGRSKLATEWILKDAAAAAPLGFAVLRYFNVAGADPAGRSGQSTPKATHLIKRACQAALGQIPYLGVFGTDFPTPDGTGVRDYIHVSDLVAAHALALDRLRGGGDSMVLNCGYGRGFSVREVICSVESAAGRKLEVRELPRRPGDLAAVVANPGRLRHEFGWRPQHDDLDEIVRHALAWERRAADVREPPEQLRALSDPTGLRPSRVPFRRLPEPAKANPRS